jgi:aspartyl-tRNA synthetase
MCGDLRESHIDDEVTLFGWVAKHRDLGGMIFVDLRDRTGVTQVRFHPEMGDEGFAQADELRSEWCIGITGTVVSRGDNANPDIPTGMVEVSASDIHVFSKSETPPFLIREDTDANEMLRLEYRYLDLRRQPLQEALIVRSKVNQIVRNYLSDNGFLEVETPYLTRSTPEGARDYLVPSRVQPGKFYALPQSPQLFKQLLMVSGFDRYFQIVRCFRDEDLRADRQPEFTQIDMEMSFVTPDDVMSICEGMVTQIFDDILGVKLDAPFTRLSYDEAVDRFGVDDPDLRFDLELVDISDEVADSDFRVFSGTVDSGGVVKGIRVPGGAESLSRKDIDALEDHAKVYGAKGLAWAKVKDDDWSGPISRFFDSDEARAPIEAKFAAEPDDLLVIVAAERSVANNSLGHLRDKLAKDLGLIDEGDFQFCWITEFPLFHYDEAEDALHSMHHPFTSPRPEDVELLDGNPEGAYAQAYDLVLNGSEIGGGSVRIHRQEVQEKIFDILGFTDEEARDKFGFLMDAFQYGPPPHGGIAFGMDRLVSLLTGKSNIRDVIAFPKTQKAADIMAGAPSAVGQDQLDELHLELEVDEEDNN